MNFLPVIIICHKFKWICKLRPFCCSVQAPVLFAKAAQIFINELSLRAWIHTEDNKRRTLQVKQIQVFCTLWHANEMPQSQCAPILSCMQTKISLSSKRKSQLPGSNGFCQNTAAFKQSSLTKLSYPFISFFRLHHCYS